MSLIMEIQYSQDPRKLIADFYSDGDQHGPLGSHSRKGKKVDKSGETKWFVVYRPTSRDAISKMLNLVGVGKGLNVKGKSAKQGCLSGFVPYIQVSDNKHKPMIEQSPPNARCKIYYKSKASRIEAAERIEKVFRSSPHLKVDDRKIYNLDSYTPNSFGLDLPEPVVREAYIMIPDLSEVFGWETGRRSEPFSMDMNLHASRGETGKVPEVVCFQWDELDALNPRGLLVAYAEGGSQVMPVVSDFDTFTVASKGMTYKQLPDEQAMLMLWSLEHTEAILGSRDHNPWTSRWIEVIRHENERGFHPQLPLYGFGDPTSYEMIGNVVVATQKCGAVRHGAECFNYWFPQELDEEFLVVWNQFGKTPWKYFTEPQLQEFLLDRIKDGYAFPINPVWCVRDAGWYDVLRALRESDEGKKVLATWFLPHLRILERVDLLHELYPDGFVQGAVGDKAIAKVLHHSKAMTRQPEVQTVVENTKKNLFRTSGPRKTLTNFKEGIQHKTSAFGLGFAAGARKTLKNIRMTQAKPERFTRTGLETDSDEELSSEGLIERKRSSSLGFLGRVAAQHFGRTGPQTLDRAASQPRLGSKEAQPQKARQVSAKEIARQLSQRLHTEEESGEREFEQPNSDVTPNRKAKAKKTSQWDGKSKIQYYKDMAVLERQKKMQSAGGRQGLPVCENERMAILEAIDRAYSGK
jgi:hypothetical protein